MDNLNENADELFEELQKISEQMDVELALAEIAEQSLVELKSIEMNPIFDEYYGGVVFESVMAKGAKKPVLRDPKGGLTAAGRAYFKRKEGANLKPGVMGPANTPEKMRRKGSFLTRFFTNPSGPMKDEKGRATRLALSAAAWGEPVPQNAEDAAKLAAKGRRLLERYQKIKEKKSITTDSVINKSHADGFMVSASDLDLDGLVSPSFVSMSDRWSPDNTEVFMRNSVRKSLLLMGASSIRSSKIMPNDEYEVERIKKAALFMNRRRKKKTKKS